MVSVIAKKCGGHHRVHTANVQLLVLIECQEPYAQCSDAL